MTREISDAELWEYLNGGMRYDFTSRFAEALLISRMNANALGKILHKIKSAMEKAEQGALKILPCPGGFIVLEGDEELRFHNQCLEAQGVEPLPGVRLAPRLPGWNYPEAAKLREPFPGETP